MNKTILAGIVSLLVSASAFGANSPNEDTRIRLEQIGAVKIKQETKTLDVLTKSFTKEELAKVKGEVAKMRATCLRNAVDRKLDYDVMTHVVHDFGNVITAPVCADYTWEGYKKYANEFAKEDPKFFKSYVDTVKKALKKGK